MTLPAIRAWAARWHYPQCVLSPYHVIGAGERAWLRFLACATDEDRAAVTARIELWEARATQQSEVGQRA